MIGMDETGMIPQLDEGMVLKGRYLVKGILDTSIRSRTYLAWDCKRERNVILKQLYSEEILPTDPGWDMEQKWFLQEADSLLKLPVDTAIPRLLDRFWERNTHYLVLEHVSGVTLAQWVQGNGPMWMTLAMQWLMMLLITLKPLHEAGLYHGGINPENILLTEDGSVTLLEWGVVRHVGDDRYSKAILNDHYAASEQYMHKGITDTYTDIYSISASFVFAATGKHPVSCLDRILEFDNDYDFGDLTLTPNIRNALTAGLQLRKHRRIQTAGKMLDILTGYHDRPPVAYTPVSVNPMAPDETEIIVPIGNKEPGSEVYYDPPEELPVTMPVGGIRNEPSAVNPSCGHAPRSGGAEEIGHTIPLEGLSGHTGTGRICYTTPIDRDALYTAPVQIQEPDIQPSVEPVQQEMDFQPQAETIQKSEVIDRSPSPPQKKKAEEGSKIPIVLGVVLLLLSMTLFAATKKTETKPSAMTVAAPADTTPSTEATVPVKEGTLIFEYEAEDFSFWVNENLELTVIISNLPLRQQYTVNLPQTPNKEHEFSWTLYAYSPARTMRFVTYYAKDDIKPAKQVVRLEDMTSSVYMTRENDRETYDYQHNIPLMLSSTSDAVIWTCKLPEGAFPIDPAGFTGFKVQTYDCGNPEKIIRRYEVG